MRREGMDWINLVLNSIFGNTVDILMDCIAGNILHTV